MDLRMDAERIINESIFACMPDKAVENALKNITLGSGKLIMVSVGKAGWQMAYSAHKILGNRIDNGIVITKYDHSKGEIPGIHIFEAGHPIPDENSLLATEKVITMVSDLQKDDVVLFLLSGGASALFEKPLISSEQLQSITSQMLASGADIVEMNTIRKRLSAVKGGRFAEICAPAMVRTIVLSDILGNPLDMIASGPAYPDASTCDDALAIVNKYKFNWPENVMSLLNEETPKKLDNVDTQVTGGVEQLCSAAAESCRKLGYEPLILTTLLNCQAREAGSFLSSIARYYYEVSDRSIAIIAGGETIVHLSDECGKGGRNQELALSAAIGIEGLRGTAIFSIGSDGTDGPTDAAGGFVDGTTMESLREKGIDVYKVLEKNNAYPCLKECNGLIITGPTGTNVNDVAVILIQKGVC